MFKNHYLEFKNIIYILLFIYNQVSIILTL